MRKWKRIVSIVLASAMVFGLCACNKESTGSIGNGDKETESTASSPDKENVYRMDEFDFSELNKEKDCSIQKIELIGDMIYMVICTYDENGERGYKLVQMKEDGTDMEILSLPTAMEQAESEETVETSGETAEQSEAESAGRVVAESDTDYYKSSIYETTNLGYFVFDDDRLYAQKTYYFEDYSDPGNYVSINEEYVCAWDLEGNMLWETPLGLSKDNSSWSYISYMSLLSNGKLVLLISGDQNGVMEVSDEGEINAVKSVDALEKYFANGGYTTVAPDGRLFLSYYKDDWSTMMVVTYDVKKNSVSASYPLPETMTYAGLANLTVNQNDDMFYTNSQGVYKYHIGEAEPTQIMSFVNSDLDISYLDAFLYLDEEHFVGLYSVYDDDTYASTIEGGLFTKVAPEDIPDKEVLVLGGNYIPSQLKKRVISYNKSNEAYRIVIKDYSQYSTNDDYSAGYTQLNNDIISGNMPDILIVDPYNMSLENYISKGLLVDVGELITNDAELAEQEFMDNVFNACMVNGKLYEVVPSFYLSTYVGKTSIIGEPEEWSMETAQAVVAKMPEGATLFGEEMTRENFFNIVMEMCGSDFVDVSTGKCNFDSEEFIALMEFAKTLPEELADDYYGDDWYTKYTLQYREDRTLLASCYLSSVENLVYTINGSFGEAVSFVGMPTLGGQGSVIYTPTTYAISAKSDNLDVAWDFIKYYLTDEYQDTLEWELPVSRTKFDELARVATKKHVYQDENGKDVEEDYTYWLNGENLILDPLTQEQVAEITDFVASIDTRAYYNEDICNIVCEEMDAFYQDQKDAKTVAGIIQSRVQLFVNENR